MVRRGVHEGLGSLHKSLDASVVELLLYALHGAIVLRGGVQREHRSMPMSSTPH